MRRIICALAFLSSFSALLAIAGGGLALLVIENSGERGMGALLALGETVAFAAVMVLLFAKEGTFGEGIYPALAIVLSIVGAAPVAALAFIAIRFAGLPLGSAMPLIDWSVLAAGVGLGIGAIAILALGHRRTQEASSPLVHMQQIRNAQQQLRAVFEADGSGSIIDEASGDIRVRPV